MEQRATPKAPEHLLAVSAHEGAGYKPLVDYASWRVALLNYGPDLEVSAITRMQRHNETDEVFVLLAGRCLLFTGEGGETRSLAEKHVEPLFFCVAVCGDLLKRRTVLSLELLDEREAFLKLGEEFGIGLDPLEAVGDCP